MKKPTLSDRALAYVRAHPLAEIPDVARELGISQAHASNTLRNLERRGKIAVRLNRGTGFRPRRQFSLSDAAGEGRAVALRGLEIGHPFGTLVSQVLR